MKSEEWNTYMKDEGIIFCCITNIIGVFTRLLLQYSLCLQTKYFSLLCIKYWIRNSKNAFVLCKIFKSSLERKTTLHRICAVRFVGFTAIIKKN